MGYSYVLQAATEGLDAAASKFLVDYARKILKKLPADSDAED